MAIGFPLWLPDRVAFSASNTEFRTPSIRQHAQAVYQQAAVLKLMPLNNATQITEDERALIRRWFEAGAPASP